MELLLPPNWPRPKGYSNGVLTAGRIVFVAGQVGWNESGLFETEDFAAQVRQALVNVVAVLAEGGAKPTHIARMTWYITDKVEYHLRRAEVGEIYREVIGNHYPAMSMVVVQGLIEDQAKVEIEVTAVIPE